MREDDDPRAAIPGFSKTTSVAALTGPAPTAGNRTMTFDLGPLPPSPDDVDELETAGSPYEPETPRLDRGATRTGTSGSTGDEKPATERDIGRLVAVVLIAVAVAGSTLVRWRTRNQYRLRQPTDDQAQAIGTPLGRIAHRHIPLPKLAKDLADGVEAAVALNRYLDDGPLTLPAIDPGLPADLNQEQR